MSVLIDIHPLSHTLDMYGDPATSCVHLLEFFLILTAYEPALRIHYPVTYRFHWHRHMRCLGAEELFAFFFNPSSLPLKANPKSLHKNLDMRRFAYVH